MKFEEASQELKRCLNESKTISIPKLQRLLKSMNFSLSHSQQDQEIQYLKNEIKKLNKQIRKMQKRGNQNENERRTSKINGIRDGLCCE